jgi:hypothetical protein
MRSRMLRYLPVAVVASIAIGSEAQAQCAVGFTSFGSSCYALSTTNTTWTAVLAEAQAAGGSLASVGSAAENAFILATFMPGQSRLWIGLNDIASEGTFVWSNGDAVTYTNWSAGEPNQFGDEDAVEMYDSGQWNDLGANNSRFGVIEVAAAQSTVPEPMTVTLMGTGLLGVMGVGYSRRRKAAP